MIKIIFFDIDGTLLPFGQRYLDAQLITALKTLQQKDIKLFIATGRPSFVVPSFPSIEFDGVLSYNGAYCYNQHEVIYNNPLDRKDIFTLIQNAAAMDRPVGIATQKLLGCNFYSRDLQEFFSIANEELYIIDDYEEKLKEDIYEMMVPVIEQEEQALLKNVTTLKCMRWFPKAVDVVSIDGGKAKGIEKILAYYGYTIDEAMAFGDGGNDVDMLTYCGTGIAMGNAMDIAKQASDYVTDTVDKDGIIKALQHFHLI